MRLTAADSKVEQQIQRYQRLKEWHLWFAWKPVRVQEKPSGLWKWVWLEFVSRRWVPVDPLSNAAFVMWDYEFPTWYP